MTFADTLPSEPAIAGSAMQRAVGRARLAIRYQDGRSRLERLYQEGAAKVRLPNVPAGAPPEAVLINTAGGLTGGDRYSVDVEIGERAGAVVTSQACEKIYRSSGGAAQVDNHIRLGPGAICAWLPQETILYDQARLERHMQVDMAADARLLAVEPLILGRTAMGETVRSGSLRDCWRIRRDGRLVHADDFRLEGDIDLLTAAGALMAGNCAAATLVLISNQAEECLEPVRGLLGENGGASAWDGRLIVRILAPGGQALRARLLPVIELLLAGLAPSADDGRTFSAALPRVWTT